MSYSLNFGSCFTFNLLKFKSKYCFKTILHKEESHFFVSFSFETQFEVHKNDPEQVFEGDIFAQTVANPTMVRSRSETESLTLFGSIIRQGFVLMVLQTISAFFTSLLWTHRQI